MAEVALWQYRWTNPGDDTNVTPDMLAWKEVKPWNMQTLEQRIEELRGFRYNGKPAYEVRALGVLADGTESGAPSPTPPFDVEAMLRECVPGGGLCDPQQVADAIRAYCGRGVALPSVPVLVPAGQVVAWMWQHEETGAVGFIDQWQVDNGWLKANPRLRLIRPLVFVDGVDGGEAGADGVGGNDGR